MWNCENLAIPSSADILNQAAYEIPSINANAVTSTCITDLWETSDTAFSYKFVYFLRSQRADESINILIWL